MTELNSDDESHFDSGSGSRAGNEPRLVIVGRPNVGKSTLFNRFFKSKRALVHDEAGVTRDRLEEVGEWWVRRERYRIRLIDTGGLGGERFAQEIELQVKAALEHADIVVMLFDGEAGLTPGDQEILRGLNKADLKKRNIPIIGVVNKVDADSHEERIYEFHETGIDPILTISAEHKRGIDELEALIIDSLLERGKIQPEPEEAEKAERIPKIAIVGRPNVGKSTLTNAILGEDRMITSPIAGTTVDAIDTIVRLNGKPYILVDTAGIRRKSKTEQGIEVLSVVQARKALERCELAILLLDGEVGISDQDEKIGGLIEEVGCSVIIGMNKWDTQKKNHAFTREDAVERVREKMAYLRYAPVMFLSAKEKTGFDDLGALAADILEQRRLKITTKEFTEWVRDEAGIHNPGNVKFYMCHMAGRNPPTFVLHVSQPDKVHFSLKRHLVNAIRERWGYMGSPIRLVFVEGKSRVGPRRRAENERKAPKPPTK